MLPIASPKKPATTTDMTLRQIDSLCDDFEAALRRGDTTLIEDFLPQVEETNRTALLALSISLPSSLR